MSHLSSKGKRVREKVKKLETDLQKAKKIKAAAKVKKLEKALKKLKKEGEVVQKLTGILFRSEILLGPRKSSTLTRVYKLGK